MVPAQRPVSPVGVIETAHCSCKSDDDDSPEESVDASWHDASSSSESETEGEDEHVATECEDVDVVTSKGEDVLLNIHDQLDLAKLQQMRDIFFAEDKSGGTCPELDMHQFSDALRLVLPDTEELSDEDVGVLFMKIDANGSGEVDWDEFTGFLLQLDEGNRNMAAAAHMVDLSPLPDMAPSQRQGGTAVQHRVMIEKVINVERPGISAYVTCGRDGTIRFWHKGTLAYLRSISHLDTIKASCTSLIMGAKGWDAEGGSRSASSAPARRAVNAMQSAWVYDIEQMPLSNRIAAACLDRTVSFYEMLTGEFVCRIAGLRFAPTCIDCIQVSANEQLVIFGDLDGILHFWAFGKHFYIPDGHQDTREAADLYGNNSIQVHSGAVSCVKYVADLNAAVTCGMDGKVHFVDLVKRRVLRTFGGHADRAVFSFAYCQRHRFVASAGMGRGVVFWNPYTMHVLARADAHASNVRHCLVDEESGRVITVSTDKAIRCWDSATFRCIQMFKDTRMHRPEDTITAALWDTSRSSLVLAGSTLGMWKNKGAIQSSKRSHEASVTAALYNKHFHQVVSGDAMGNVHVWLVETGHVAFRFAGAHGTSKICCMSFDASERRLLTGANDGTVKLWNFSNGKVLQEFGPGMKPGARAAEASEVSGLVHCKDSMDLDQDSVGYVATCSWDRKVRIFGMGESCNELGHNTQDPQSGQGDVRTPLRVFPEEKEPRGARGCAGGGGGGSTDSVGDGHTADILSIAHCGHQQVATGGFDGRIFAWATDSGKVKFSVKPSEHDISQVDEVSSIGGLTSVATMMQRQRKAGLATTDDADDANSAGYLERMQDLLAEDASTSRVSWDGREYFAEERMGGSDDGSGSVEAAEIPAEGQEGDEDTSAADVAEPPTATADACARTDEAAPETETATHDSPTAPSLGDKYPEKSSREDENKAVTTAALSSTTTPGEATRQDDDSDAKEGSAGVFPAPVMSGEQSSQSAALSAKDTGAANENIRSGAEGTTAGGHGRGKEQRQGSVKNGTREDGGVVGVAAAAGVRSGCHRNGKQAENSTKPRSEKRRRDNEDAGQDNKQDGVVELLEIAASHTVDCLLFIRCHDVLVSGTASGELHFWDASTGALIFGRAARHPNDAGMSAMGSSEGTSVGGGSDPSSAKNLLGVAAATGTASMDNVNLLLYTACEEGFVKTWKVGDITEHAYQTGLRARPKPDRKARTGRIGKTQNLRGGAGGGADLGTTPAAPTPAVPGQANPADPNNSCRGTQKSLLSPAQQWQAHETNINSVEGANYRGKVDLLVTAGVDCYVHLWTVGGAHVGTFGQPRGTWSLGSRATWIEASDQAVLGHNREMHKEDEEDDRSVTTGASKSSEIRESRSGLRGSGEGSSRRMANRSARGMMRGGGSSEKQTRKNDGREDNRPRDVRDRDLAKEQQEMERYQEQRYYTASQNRVQRKLLRGRLTAFCMSRDYDTKDQLQEVSNILGDTRKKNSPHPPGSSARPSLSKHRITSILRNTYNQVSFQLQLHRHEDVHERAESTLLRRKARRRAKSANGYSHPHHFHNNNNRPAQTPVTTPSTPAAEMPPQTLAPTNNTTTTLTAADPTIGGCGGGEVGRVAVEAGGKGGGDKLFSGAAVRGPASGCGEIPVVVAAAAAAAAELISVDGRGNNNKGDCGGGDGTVCPAAPTHPPSSCVTNGRRFRRPSATEGRAGGGG